MISIWFFIEDNARTFDKTWSFNFIVIECYSWQLQWNKSHIQHRIIQSHSIKSNILIFFFFFLHLVKACLLKTIHAEVLIHCYQFGKVFLHIHENEKRFVLSTNITRSNYFVNLQRFLTKIKNNNRPKIKPWGTPYLIVSIFVCLSPYIINCFLFDKLLSNLLRLHPLISYNSSFIVRILWSTVSIALLRSMKIPNRNCYHQTTERVYLRNTV